MHIYTSHVNEMCNVMPSIIINNNDNGHGTTVHGCGYTHEEEAEDEPTGSHRIFLKFRICNFSKINNEKSYFVFNATTVRPLIQVWGAG